MSLFDKFRYDGKRVLVVGGATGMGAATAELALDAGAEVVVMDFAKVKLSGVKSIQLDLADKASIEGAVDECGGPVHALFACAGVADGTPGIERINFIGHRHLIDRAIARGMLGRGSAIGFISSAAGLAWRTNLPKLVEFLDIADFDAAAQWAREHEMANYMWTKQTICAYVSARGDVAAETGDPDQRPLPGPDRHAARTGQQGHVARVRRRLPRRGGHRARDLARAGVSPRVPVQRRGVGDHRDYRDQRRRLPQRGNHRGRSRLRPRSPSSSWPLEIRPWTWRCPRSRSSSATRSRSCSPPSRAPSAYAQRSRRASTRRSGRRWPRPARSASASPRRRAAAGAGLLDAVLLAEQAGRHLASAPIVEGGRRERAARALERPPRARDAAPHARRHGRAHARAAQPCARARRSSSRAARSPTPCVGLDGDALVLVTRGDEPTPALAEPRREPRRAVETRRRAARRRAASCSRPAPRRTRLYGAALEEWRAAHAPPRSPAWRGARSRSPPTTRAARTVRPADRRVPGHRAPARRRRDRRRRCAPAHVVRGLVDRARAARRRRRWCRSASRGRRAPRRARSRARCTRTAATASRSSTTSSSTTAAGRPGRSRRRPARLFVLGAERRWDGAAGVALPAPATRTSSSASAHRPRRCARGARASSRSTSRPSCARACTSAGTATTRDSSASWPRPGSCFPPGRASTAAGRRDPWQAAVIREEFERAGWSTHAIGTTGMVADDRARVRRARSSSARCCRASSRGEAVMRLGYTEPASGSDVAAAQTRAVRDGDHWVIDGQKMFTSGARPRAVRLPAHAHRPERRQAQGTHDVPRAARHARASRSSPIAHALRRAHQRDLLRGVRVPDRYRVGEVNGGWTVLAYALEIEHARRLGATGVAAPRARRGAAALGRSANGRWCRPARARACSARRRCTRRCRRARPSRRSGPASRAVPLAARAR